MSASRGFALAPAAAMAMHLAGCAAATPPEYRRSMQEAQWKPTGAFVRVQLHDREYAGELIAVEPEAFVVEKSGQPFLLPPQCVDKVTLSMFEAGKASTVVWGLFGALSTLSHGKILILSAPVWILSTAVATAVQSGAGRLYEERPVTKPELQEGLRKWARFPQGLPTGYLPPMAAGTTTGMACGYPYAMPSRWFH